MARPLQLETFEVPGLPEHYESVGQAELEELRLATYEQGYAAGWDDAVTAQTDEITRLRADLGRNLVDMSLSYRDAKRHILGALEPLLHDMVTKVLPGIAHQSLGPIILEQLRPVAETAAGAPVLIKTAPENLETVERLLSQEVALPIRVIAEPTLGSGQAYLKIAESEALVDLDGAILAISAAVLAFFSSDHSDER